MTNEHTWNYPLPYQRWGTPSASTGKSFSNPTTNTERFVDLDMVCGDRNNIVFPQKHLLTVVFS